MLTPCNFWVAVGCVAIIFELGHPGLFFFLSLSFGAVVAAIVSMYRYSLGVQVVFFFIGTILAAIFSYFWLKYIERSTVRTNMDALVGKSALIIADISFCTPGYVKIGGERWLARSEHKKVLVSGMHVRIIAVQGAHVLVKELRSS